MSSFKIEGEKLIDGLFPELYWEELTTGTYNKVLQTLLGIDQLNDNIAKYLRDNKIRIGFHKQYKSGGGWTFLRNITLSPGGDPVNPYVLSLIIHETFHLKQTIWMRLSVQGELGAWQYQIKTYPYIAKTKGAEIGTSGEAYGESRVTQEYWGELANLSPDSREDLEQAQEVMMKISPGYRSGCLPLYPINKEFGYFWNRKEYSAAFGAIWKLITCR